MMRATIWSCAIAVAIGIASGTAHGAAAEPPARTPSSDLDCTGALLPDGHRCLRVAVKEDRADPRSRLVQLHVHVWPARRPQPGRQALFVLAGGPGDRPAAALGEFSKPFEAEREDRDLVVIDPRGSDDSPDLRCWADAARSSPDIATDASLWPAGQMRACLSSLATMANPAHYTTDDAADDVEDVRRQLGYGPVDVVAYSYGTRLAQVVVRRHPQAVRSAILIGPLPLGEHIPEHVARHAERAAQLLLNACLDTPECRRARPGLMADWDLVKRRIADDDFVLRSPDGAPPRHVSAGIVASWIRSRLYGATTAVTLPAVVQRLARRDDQEILARIVRWRAGFAHAGAWGVYLSVTCAEDLPYIHWDAALQEAAGSFVGDYRLRIQREACAAWPVPTASDAFGQPLVSDVPVLVLVGEMDPITPPMFGERLVRTLSRARLVRVPARGHDVSEAWDECLGPLTHAFIKDGSGDRIDARCVERLTLPPFPN